MSWVRIDDAFADHPKLLSMGRDRFAAIGVHLAALCYASRYLTDGFLPVGFVAQFPGHLVTKLCRWGLWDDDEGGFRIHDYLDYNPSRAAVEADREKARERMNRARRTPDVRTNNGRTSHNPVPYPSPTPKGFTEALGVGAAPTALLIPGEEP